MNDVLKDLRTSMKGEKSVFNFLSDEDIICLLETSLRSVYFFLRILIFKSYPAMQYYKLTFTRKSGHLLITACNS